jgi:hypothetical protein
LAIAMDLNKCTSMLLVLLTYVGAQSQSARPFVY